MAKNKKHRDGIVYSTNPDFEYNYFSDLQLNPQDNVGPGQMSLRVSIDRKQRAGKEVTLITGFVGTDDALQTLGKQLKNKCGVGGTAKDGEIILQGNHKDKVIQWLISQGYTNTKGSGG